MEIRKAETRDVLQIFEFNTLIFPNKKISSKRYLDFWFSKSEDDINNQIILVDDDGNVKGQVLSSSMTYYYKGNRVNTAWIFDLIVDESLRKSAWGIDLLLKCMEVHPKSCSTGSGPTALPIHLKLGNSFFGEIRKYVGVVNPFYFLTSWKRNAISISKYPNKIHYRNYVFNKIETSGLLPDYDVPFNDDLFEISREKEYLNWRYFNNLHQYAFYLSSDGKAYFVLRSILLKGFRVMELVDYRCQIKEVLVETIYQAAVGITKALHLPVLVCGSSLSIVDSVFERHHFKSIGRPRPVIGFVKCKDRKEDIDNRNFCFVTFADSDGETNWI